MDGSLELLHGVTRTTVTIAARIPPDHPSAAVLGTARFGTGTVVAEHGLVLTVSYVVLGADHVVVTDLEGREYRAVPAAHDFLTGIALLRIDADLPVIDEGSSSALERGTDVFAVAAVGNAERRVASGTVTSFETFDAYWEYRLERAIWSTCTNPGLGGGPVCDSRGRLVGIVSLSLGVLGRSSLAIPAENFYQHADELLTHGGRASRPRRAWVGMFCHAFPDRTIIAGLIPGAPGERSGLLPGDVVLNVGPHRIRDRSELYELIWAHRPGDKLELGVYRDGRIARIAVTTGDAEDFFT